ncbi:MAG: hypothetical protein VW877_02985 [Pseudomonadaceae bacterium]
MIVIKSEVAAAAAKQAEAQEQQGSIKRGGIRHGHSIADPARVVLIRGALNQQGLFRCVKPVLNQKVEFYFCAFGRLL